MKITIRGASDDLIEVEGDIGDEFPGGDVIQYLGFSDGTLLTITYGAEKEAFWRINRLTAGTATYTKVEATDEQHYSDIVTLEGEFTWVVCGTQCDRKRPAR